MKKLIIIGAGGAGRETVQIVEDINGAHQTWNLLGYIDGNLDLHGQEINGYGVLGGLEYLHETDEEIYVVCAIANYSVKKRMIEELKDLKHIKFATLIHPTACIHRTSTIGEGSIVYPYVVVTTNVKIGNHVIVSPRAGIGHDTVIGDYSTLLWGVNIAGNVRLNTGVFIGSGASVIQGLEVASASLIGAGALVTKNINQSGTYIGVPVRRVK